MQSQTPDYLIRPREVVARTGLSTSALHREVTASRFPRPVPLVPGGRAVGYSARAVQAWIDERLSAGGAA
ncbi:MAG: AlpA family phage regulatory protein [Xanthomonadales bacterium]|nr:AlpA family phage regulatory protein [Xanthomonadales bacterium]